MMQPSGTQQQMIVDSFQSAIYVQDKMDVQHTPVYDTVTIAAGGTVSTLTTAFFTNVGAASNKTLAQTNMTQQQKLPAPEAFSIFGIRLRWQEDILLADLLTLLSNFALSLILGQKRYQLAPLWYFSSGGGISGFSTQTTESVYTNGWPGREAMHKLAIPIVIENQMTFYGQFEGNTQTLTAAVDGGTGATLQLVLDGLYARGVQ
jgi:hypothetical protein